MSQKQQIIVVSGPTASNKSALAVSLALALGAEIINLDSVQLYAELEIGANKLAPDQMRGVPHHLLGIVPPDQQVNVNYFIELAQQKINEIERRGKVVILVGGSTMYLSLLLHGIAELPVADAELRAQFSKLSNSEIHARLLQGDKEAAGRIHHNDRLRLERALEIQIKGIQTQSTAYAQHAYAKLQYDAHILLPTWERATLRERIFQRTAEMLKVGLMLETRALLDKYGRAAPALSSIGYRECLQVIEGQLAQEQLAEKISVHTYQYAKRQMLFFRNEPIKLGWSVEPASLASDVQLVKTTHKNEREQLVYAWTIRKLLVELEKRVEGVHTKWLAANTLFSCQ